MQPSASQIRWAPDPHDKHHKFAIFDGRLLVTGSYNWTDAAESRNLENALFLDDPALIARYGEWFDRQFAGATAAR